MKFFKNARQVLVETGAVCLLLFPYAPAAEPFTEEATLRGIDYIPMQTHSHGQGLAFIDLDGDGDADVVMVGRFDGMVGVYENDGTGYFIDRSATSGIGPALKSSGVTAADFDRDGDLDVHISRWTEPDMLLRNEGGFVFQDVSAESGIGAAVGRHTGSAWGDYDNDGWPDLYVPNWWGPSRLYHNLGDGTFEELASRLGVDLPNAPLFQAVFVDFDRDGDADLYVAADRGLLCETEGWQNHLFENVGGTFVDITDASGTAACVDAMCIAIGDFDDNRYMDFYITNTPSGNALLLNQGDGTFSEGAAEAGVSVFETGWGAVFFDYDNSGSLDLYVCNGNAPNVLFDNDTAWPCNEVGAQMNVDVGGYSYTLATADIDNDGDLDFLLENRFEKIRLFINHEGETRRWAKFDVVGEGPSRYAIGANIDVRTGADWQIREVIAGSNYKNQNELVQHFGLGSAAAMDEVVVMWPGGATRTLYNLLASQTWTLYPTDKLGDGDHDGDRDIDDFVIFASCYAMPLAPGCEMMDFDGSGAFDMGDFAAFLGVFDGTPADCNDNGILDMEEMLLDPLLDADGDGALDACGCAGDLDGSGDVGAFDLALLLGAWGPCEGCPADLNGDGQVAAFDLALLLGAWGPCED
ncbi:MAG: VCBS repeat-containing protein [Planctomycetes bacterium]|nr:VCBS repeat-containing protein [Planctomycetota bacterium]